MYPECKRLFMGGVSFSVSALSDNPKHHCVREEKPSVQSRVPQGKFSASNYRKQYLDLGIKTKFSFLIS